MDIKHVWWKVRCTLIKLSQYYHTNNKKIKHSFITSVLYYLKKKATDMDYKIQLSSSVSATTGKISGLCGRQFILIKLNLWTLLNSLIQYSFSIWLCLSLSWAGSGLWTIQSQLKQAALWYLEHLWLRNIHHLKKKNFLSKNSLTKICNNNKYYNIMILLISYKWSMSLISFKNV